jgi:hypothetical protein
MAMIEVTVVSAIVPKVFVTNNTTGIHLTTPRIRLQR